MVKSVKAKKVAKKKALNSKKTINAKRVTKAYKTKSVGVVVPKKLNTFVLIDRSGSMETKWNTVIKSVNEYINTLKQDKIEGQISIAFFDSNSINNSMSFDIVVNQQPIDSVVFSADGYRPRGMTPLYDATGRAIACLDSDPWERTALVIVTDGDENFSKEFNKEQITQKMNTFKARNWEVLFLGADFDTDTQSRSVGIGLNKSLGGSASTLVRRMGLTGQSVSAYTMTGAAVNYTDNDRASGWSTTQPMTNTTPVGILAGAKVIKTKSTTKST